MGPITRVTTATVDVLGVLLAEQEPVWGLRIAKQTGNAPGTIYPILSRLENGGWIEASWETDSERPGPRRRLYRLTESGRAEAQGVVAIHAGRVRRATAAMDPRFA